MSIELPEPCPFGDNYDEDMFVAMVIHDYDAGMCDTFFRFPTPVNNVVPRDAVDVAPTQPISALPVSTETREKEKKEDTKTRETREVVVDTSKSVHKKRRRNSVAPAGRPQKRYRKNPRPVRRALNPSSWAFPSSRG